MHRINKQAVTLLAIVGAVLFCVAAITLLTVPQGGTGAATFTAHGVLVGQGASALTATTTGSAGQLLVSNGSSSDPTFQDPIVSFNYANLINAQAATGTVTGSAVRLSTLSAYGVMYVTFASITGSPSACTVQLKNYDSLGNSINTAAAVSVTAANGTTSVAIAPASGLQAAAQMSATFACSVYPSAGTVSVDFVPGPAAGIQGTLSDNVAAPSANNIGVLNAIARTDYRGGTAATAGRAVMLEVGSDGLLHVSTLPDMSIRRYRASSKFAASSTTDNWRINGNASTTVVVTDIRLTCTQTTAGILNVELAKRSTAGSGGTAASVAAVPLDSNKAAATSVVNSYTGTGPTVGTLVGDIDNAQVGCLAAATATPNDIYVAPRPPGSPVAVLRGVAEGVAINLGNAAVTGGNITVTVEWLEITTITP